MYRFMEISEGGAHKDARHKVGGWARGGIGVRTAVEARLGMERGGGLEERRRELRWGGARGAGSPACNGVRAARRAGRMEWR